MFPVRYVHAADVHLDAAFYGLSREIAHAGVAQRLREATFTALERLIALCERERPHFCVIAGDMYNQEDRSLRAQMALRDGCERLNACGVRVFIAHGNHDPLSSRLQTLRWPENTVIFGESVSSHIVALDDVPIAVVHGISHAAAREQRNLAPAFSRLRTDAFPIVPPIVPPDAHQNAPCFQLGVLHCALDGLKAARYAPCTVDDLIATRLDAFALGHVHERRIVHEAPFIAYPGNVQGLHIHETGPRGCLLVTAAPHTPHGQHKKNTAPSFICEATFHPLGPVRWESVRVPLDSPEPSATPETLDEVENAVREALDKVAGAVGPECDTVLVRVIFTGSTLLDNVLRDSATLSDFTERLRSTPTGHPLVWIKDCVLETRPLLDRGASSLRQDLLGETLRFARDQRADIDAFAALTEGALAPLFRHARMRQMQADAPTGAALDTLFDEAELLCADMLEAR